MTGLGNVASFDAVEPGLQFEMLSEVVTTRQLVRYAGASDDYNPIHYDLSYATEAGLGGVIAHGMLTMGFMARAVGEQAGESGLVKRIAARFTSPVRPGDAVLVTGTVTAKRRTDLHGELECALVASVGAKRVAEGDATLLLVLTEADAKAPPCGSGSEGAGT